MGKDAKHGSSSACQKKGSTNARWAKEAFAAYESSLGGKKESRRNQNGRYSEERHTYTGRSKETLRLNEGALGSEKKRRREITTAIDPSKGCCEIEASSAARVTARERSRTSTGFPIRS